MKVAIFEMEGLFGSCLVYFVIAFVWDCMSARRFHFDSEMLSSPLRSLSQKCSGMVEKDDGVVPEWVKSHLQYLQVILWVGEIPTAELGSHLFLGGGCPVYGAALSGL